MNGFSSDDSEPRPVADAELDDLTAAEFDAYLRGVVEGEQRGRDREWQAYADGLLDGAAVRRPRRLGWRGLTSGPGRRR